MEKAKEKEEKKEKFFDEFSVFLGVLLLMMIGIMCGPTLYKDYKEYTKHKEEQAEKKAKKEAQKEHSEFIEKANNAMAQGDFFAAYNIVDQMIANNHYDGYDLNKKILTNEIAANIESANAAKIILCIKERARYNGYSESNRVKEETEMLKHAIQLAEAIDDSETAKKLQKALASWEKAKY